MLAIHSVKGIRLNSYLHVQYGEREITTAKRRSPAGPMATDLERRAALYLFLRLHRQPFLDHRRVQHHLAHCTGLYQSEEAMENLIQEEINNLASLNFRFISCGLSDAENERRIELSLRDAMSQLPSA